jgi:hypothetical protein
VNRGDVLAGLLGLVLGLGAVCAWVGVPRLYGVGCEAYAVVGGFQLAQEEDDFRGQCRRIEALPWAW